MLDKETTAIAQHSLKKVLGCLNNVLSLPGWTDCQETTLSTAYIMVEDLKAELEEKADAPE